MSLFSTPVSAGAPVLGLGGFHVGKVADPDLAVAIVHRAIEVGFALLDNAWDYHAGESERRVGRALASGGYRDRVIVMTKVDSHSRDGVMRQVSESLDRLGMAYVDLLQLHEVIRAGDGQDAVARGGLRALAELREQGVARHIGITGHKDPRFIVEMLDAAEAAGVALETAQMPINAADVHADSFTLSALPVCLARGVEVIAMKPLGGGDLLAAGTMGAPELLRWAMSQPVAAVVTGCQTLFDVDQAARVHDAFVPMTEPERADLQGRAADALDARRIIESYKTTEVHDSTTRHPEWRE